MTVPEIRARLVALVAQIDGAVPASQVPPTAQSSGAPKVDLVTVAAWQVQTSKAGKPYARLTTTAGIKYPVFAPHLLALDPIPAGSQVELTLQQAKNADGTTFEKLSPDRPLGSVPYAMMAEMVLKLESQNREVRQLRHELEKLLRWRFGPKPRQGFQ